MQLGKKFTGSNTDVFWSYTGTVFSMASNFLLLPFIFHFLTRNEVGFWYLILSINGLTALLDFGFDPAFARNIAYVWSGIKSLHSSGVGGGHNRIGGIDYSLLAATIQTARAIYLILSIVALGLISTLGSLYMVNIVFQTLNGSVYFVTWWIFCFSIFLNLYFGYFSALLRGSGKIAAVNKAIVFSRIIQITFTAVGFLATQTIIVPVVGLVVYGILFRSICNYYFWQDPLVKNHVRILRKRVAFSEILTIFQKIWPNTWRDGIVSIANYLTNQGMTLVAGIFLPLATTGTYSIGIQFAAAIGTGASAINGAIHPVLQSAFVNHNYSVLQKYTAYAVTTYVWLYWIGAFVVTAVVFPLLTLAKPGAVPGLEVFGLLLFYFFFYQLHSIHASYIANANIIPYTGAFVISGIVNIGLLWLTLSITKGSMGMLLLIPIIVQGVCNNWYWPHYYYQMIDSSFKNSLKTGNVLIRQRFRQAFDKMH